MIWLNHLCHGVLTYYPPSPDKAIEAGDNNGTEVTSSNAVLPLELEVTLLQMVVLLAWRYREITQKLSLDDLATSTAMSDADLRRTIWVSFRLKMSLSDLILTTYLLLPPRFSPSLSVRKWTNRLFSTPLLPNRRRTSPMIRISGLIPSSALCKCFLS